MFLPVKFFSFHKGEEGFDNRIVKRTYGLEKERI